MTTTSRRAILAGAATLPALAVPALAGKPHPDADLLVLVARWEKTLDKIAAVYRQHELEYEEYERGRLPIPDVCKARPADGRDLGPAWAKPRGYRGEDDCYSLHQIEGLRCIGDTYQDGDCKKLVDGDVTTLTLTQFEIPVNKARVAEILEAWDEWDAHDDALLAETGVGRHDDIGDAIHDVRRVLEDAILDVPVRTIDGLAAKAKVALQCFDCACTLEEARAKLDADRGGDGAEEHLWHLVRDILAMQAAA